MPKSEQMVRARMSSNLQSADLDDIEEVECQDVATRSLTVPGEMKKSQISITDVSTPQSKRHNSQISEATWETVPFE